MKPIRDADQDSFFGAALRLVRHPLRILVMATAAFCLVADVALGPGIGATVLGAAAGVLVGEIFASTRLRLAWILAGFSSLAALALATGALLVRVEGLVEIFGTGGALVTAGVLRYGAIALVTTASMRAVAKRHPSWLALELGFVVLGVAAALASHRHGVIARPLWLSDFAWRRGLDPADALVGIGVAAALAAVSLLVFERKGKLSLAALPLLPLIAMLAISCLEFTGAGPERGDASPDALDAESEDPRATDRGEEGPGQRGADAGTPRDAGASAQDGGGSRRDGGADGGAGGGDGGLDGGTAGGADGGLDGGGSAGGDGGADGGAGGGGADASRTDAGGGGGGWEGWDAGLDDTELPPPQMNEGGGGGGASGSADDILETPPPTGEASAAPAAVVLFENDYSPPSETYYFRQDAWSHFDGRRLVPTSIPEADRDVADHFPNGRHPVLDPPPEAGRAVVAATVALLVAHPQPFALESPVWLDDARNPNPARFRRAYRFLSRAQSAPYAELLGRRAGSPDWTEPQRQLYLQPHPDPRFEEFALETVNRMPPGRRGDPFARAVAIKLRLDQLLTYSTRERHADAEDPTVDFFFGNRIGYCVHFAHTAVFLWRSVGIPSRIGVGYGTPEANRQGGSALLIRSGDAHAWPELYLEGVGWVVLDIAAANNLDPARPAQDEDLQRLLGEMAREQPPDPEDEIRPPEAPIMPPWWDWRLAFLFLFLAALALVLSALFLVKAWRRLAPSFAKGSSLPRVAFRLSLDRLAEVGLAREYGETREEFARRAAALSPAFEEATDLALGASFGPPGGVDERRWREVTRAVKTDIRRGTKWWRRLLGLLFPVSFLDSR